MIRRAFVVLECGTWLLLLCSLTGCGGGAPASGTNPVSPTGPVGASSIYVVQQGNPYLVTPTLSYVLQFSVTAEGSVTPVSSLTLPVAYVAYSVAVDSAGQVYVGGYQGSLYTSLRTPQILVYAPGANGPATPARTILPSGLAVSLAIDHAGQLYAANSMTTNPTLAVYSPNADGAATPAQLVEGPLTQLHSPLSIAVDANENIYVTQSGDASSPGNLFEFAAGATGNVAPMRSITSTTALFDGVAVDATGNVFAAANQAPPLTATLMEFAPGASGPAIPIRTISGSSTKLSTLGGLRVDDAGNLYVANVAAGATTGALTFSIAGFGSTASGNVSPAIQFTSTAWTTGAPEIALH